MLRTSLLAAALALFAVSSVAAAEVVPVALDVPAELAGFAHPVPVTFGLPLAEGEVALGAPFLLTRTSGAPIPAGFEITGLWPGGDSIRWLLVRALVPPAALADGALELWIDEGKGLRARPSALVFGDHARPRDLAPVLAELAAGTFGDVELHDGAGGSYRAFAAPSEVMIEREDALGRTVRIAGGYSDGAGELARHVTRVHTHAGLPLVRVVHTLEWVGAGGAQLARLSYRLPGDAAGATATAGVDGVAQALAGDFSVVQLDTQTLVGASGARLDGWLRLEEAGEARVVALRWPWQQHPVGLSREGDAAYVDLYRPVLPATLDANEQAATPELAGFVGSNWDVPANAGPLGPLTPEGLAKSWELLLWVGPDAPDAAALNALLQEPVLAIPDPAFAVRAELPAPMGAARTDRRPDLEGAIGLAFDWATRELVDEGDFGTWNFGDLQYDWRTNHVGSPLYRYWMGHGTGWSTLPWMLWLRSGERRYLEHAVANARHLMDVATNHVDGWTSDFHDKQRGGQGAYQPIHGAWSRNKLLVKTNDSEYLQLAYYLTGEERAWDVNLVRRDGFLAFDHDEHLAPYEADPATCSREVYRLLGEGALLYESSGDDAVGALVERYLDLALAAQRPSGMFPGITSAFYLGWPLQLAARALPARRAEVRDALAAWSAFRGTVATPGVGYQMEGPISAWSALERAREDGQLDGLVHMTRLARSQAASVHAGPPDWRGVSGVPIFYSPFAVRAWLACLAGIDGGLVDGDEPQLPASHWNGWFPLTAEQESAGWVGRHVAVVLEERDAVLPLAVGFRLNALADELDARVNVYGPDGALVVSATKAVTAFHYYEFDAEPWIELDVPADGLTGGYAVEVLTALVPVPVAVLAPDRRVVHLAHADELVAVCASSAGSLHGRALGDGPARYEHSSHHHVPRRALLDPAGGELASSSITGTAPSGLPLEAFAPYLPAAGDPLELLAFNDDWHVRLELIGLRDAFAARGADWFEPRDHVTYDLDAFLAP